MDFTDDAIVLSTRRHGESDAILSVLTRANGRHLGLVKGGASRRQRPVLEIGNRLKVVWRARLAEQLGNFQVESTASVAAGFLDDPLRLAGLAAACAVADIVLPEREPQADVFDATAALIDAIAGIDTGIDAGIDPGIDVGNWPAAYVRWELELLTSLGFGLDLTHCAATGETTDLAFVSPKTGRAVGRIPGNAYADRLLPLPRFLIEAAVADSADVLAGLRLTGYFLDRHVLHGPTTERRLEARARFLDRLATRS